MARHRDPAAQIGPREPQDRPSHGSPAQRAALPGDRAGTEVPVATRVAVFLADLSALRKATWSRLMTAFGRLTPLSARPSPAHRRPQFPDTSPCSRAYCLRAIGST